MKRVLGACVIAATVWQSVAVAAPSSVRIGRYVVDNYNLTGGGSCLGGSGVILTYSNLRAERFVDAGLSICPTVSNFCAYENAAATGDALANGTQRKTCDMLYIAGHSAYYDQGNVHNTGVLLGCSYSTYGAVGTMAMAGYWRRLLLDNNNRWIYTNSCQLLLYTDFTAMNAAWGPVFKGVHVFLGARSDANHYFSDEATSRQWYFEEGQKFWNYWYTQNRSIWAAYLNSRKERAYVPAGEQLSCLAAKHPQFQPYPIGGPCYHSITYSAENNNPALHEIQIYVWATYGTPEW